jgi:lipid-A-disaccharide synthase
MASGTTTLEALLLKKPMVVAYRMAPLSYAIISRMVKTRYISLPNLLADNLLVPEILQKDVTADKLGPALLERLNSPGLIKQLTHEFEQIHKKLRCDANTQAAKALLALIERRKPV